MYLSRPSKPSLRDTDMKLLAYSLAVERRKKVTRACDYCKKRKYKCIGTAPCDLCKKKKIPCEFLIVDRRTTKGKGTEGEVPTLAQLKNKLPEDISVGKYHDSAPHRASYPTDYSQPSPQGTYGHQTNQQYYENDPYQRLQPLQVSYSELQQTSQPIQQFTAHQHQQSPPQTFPNYAYEQKFVQFRPSASQPYVVSPLINGTMQYTPYYSLPSDHHTPRGQPIGLYPSSYTQNSVPFLIPNQQEATQASNQENLRAKNNATTQTAEVSDDNRAQGTHFIEKSDKQDSHIASKPQITKNSEDNVLNSDEPETKRKKLSLENPFNGTLGFTKQPSANPQHHCLAHFTIRHDRLGLPNIANHHSTENLDSSPSPLLTAVQKLPPASKLLKVTYIPKSLQPLLSFPMEEKEEDTREVTRNSTNAEKSTPKSLQGLPTPKKTSDSESDEGNTESKDNNIVFDSKTSTRYIGESSPLLVLFEARKIFSNKIGESDFTRDVLGICFLDEPVQLRPCVTVGLPSREACEGLIQIFQSNINQSWYIFNKKYFEHDIIDFVYNAQEQGTRDQCLHKVALLHLTLALGLYFANLSHNPVEKLLTPEMTSTAFFNSGFNIVRNTVDDGKLWLTEAYFLIHFYYQSKGNRSTSWLMLGNAIRNAQALGLHRKYINESYTDKQVACHRRKLWVSLYVCDRISSILLGRPLLIGDYDWDDFDVHEELIESEPDNRINLMCLIEIAKVAVINGKTVHNFYLSGKINPFRAEKLAIEFKSWSMNLPSEIQIHKILNYLSEKSEISNPTNKVRSDNFLVFALHLAQMYGIMLLTRPFFLYTAFRHSKGLKQSSRSQEIMMHFCRANVKALVLTIVMIHFYMQQYTERVELYAAVNCCFMAAIPLGLSVLHRKLDPSFVDDYDTMQIMKHLETARKILETLGPICEPSVRLCKIVTMMKLALLEKYPDLTVERSQSADITVNTPENIGNDSDVAKDEAITNTPIEHLEIYEYKSRMNSQGASYVSVNRKSSCAFPSLGQEFPTEISMDQEQPLEMLLDFHEHFVPQGAHPWASEEVEKPQDLYNIGTSDILFDNNL